MSCPSTETPYLSSRSRERDLARCAVTAAWEAASRLAREQLRDKKRYLPMFLGLEDA
jgi:hypothetical protein